MKKAGLFGPRSVVCDRLLGLFDSLVGTKDEEMNQGFTRPTLILGVLLVAALLLAVRLYSNIKTTALRAAEFSLVDAESNAPVTNFHVRTPPVAADLHQIILLRAPEGRFILARIGNDPIQVTILANGYAPARVDLGNMAFRNDPITVRMERKPDIAHRKEVQPIRQQEIP